MIARLRLAVIGCIAVAGLFIELIGNHIERRRDARARREGMN